MDLTIVGCTGSMAGPESPASCYLVRAEHEGRTWQVVLDLGSGGGIDVLLSARRVGPTGFAYGVDMTEEMLAEVEEPAQRKRFRRMVEQDIARLYPGTPTARRATLDLHGLPPTPEEIDQFVNDKSPDAFAKVVDRLLASPQYGERWGRPTEKEWAGDSPYLHLKGNGGILSTTGDLLKWDANFAKPVVGGLVSTLTASRAVGAKRYSVRAPMTPASPGDR